MSSLEQSAIRVPLIVVSIYSGVADNWEWAIVD